MNTPNKILFFSSIIIFLAYLIYGIFFLEFPRIGADENWEISLFRNLIQHHRLDQPMFTKEVSPFFAMYFNATPANQLLGIIKTGAFCISYLLLPLDENQAVRFTSFMWSLLLCFSVYMLAKEFKLSRFYSWLSVIILIITPEFLLQIHTSRAEITLAFSFAFFAAMLLRALKAKDENNQKIYLILIGLASWIPAIGLHPTGLFLPPALGIIYLVLKKKKYFFY